MGNRFWRKRTLRVKKEETAIQRVYSSTLIPCPSREGLKISGDVCLVSQVRHPKRCKGCGHFTGEVPA